jgi:hypothetical protein
VHSAVCFHFRGTTLTFTIFLFVCWKYFGEDNPSVPKSSYSSYLPAYEDGTDSVPKRQHIKFRRRGITQKKAYNPKSLTHVHAGSLQHSSVIILNNHNMEEKSFNHFYRIIMSFDNHRLPLPVHSFIVLMWPTQLIAQTHSTVGAGSDSCQIKWGSCMLP